MTNGQLYARAMAATLRIVEHVPADRWHAPTPCTEWDARQVANHIISENLWAGELFQGKTVAEVGSTLDGDLTGEDPATAYRRSVEVARKAVEAPGAMEATCRLSFGDNILIVRNRTPAPKVDHIAYTIAGWDTDKSVKPAVEAELKRRGLQIRTTEGSFHVSDPEGFEVQMGGKEQ